VDNSFYGIYTLIEIAINHNISIPDIKRISRLMNKKDSERIGEEFPVLQKFLPYCKWYSIQGNNVLAMPAYTYDLYKATGILPSLDNFDLEPDTERLEEWQYINPIVFEITPDTGFDFAKNIYPDSNIWSLFLSGSARMNYYEESQTTLEQRIKYAIVEYMMRRPQFYNSEDFTDNEILHRKYNKNYKKKEEEGKEDDE